MKAFIGYDMARANRSTRIKHMPKFPINKYITFRCAMNHIGELPEDIIKYLLYLIIGTDKIDFRLKITETILEYFNIETLNIQFPKEGNLSYGEIHEAMALKMFHISLMVFDERSYKEQFWGNGITLNYCDDIVQKKISINSEIECVSCINYDCRLYNDVPICKTCKRRLKSINFRYDVRGYFYDALTIPESDIWPVLNCKSKSHANYEEFDELIPASYYNYLEYDFPSKKIQNNNNFPIKELRYISKKVQEERIEKEREILRQIDLEIQKIKNNQVLIDQMCAKINNMNNPNVCGIINT